MASDMENKVKIRFKFRSGEEFEAEGSPDFIEKQRADFLHLIGKEKKAPACPPSTFNHPQYTPAERPQPTPAAPGHTLSTQTDESFSSAPAALRRGHESASAPLQAQEVPDGAFPALSPAPHFDSPSRTASEGYHSSHFAFSQGPERVSSPQNNSLEQGDNLRWWEEIAKIENEHVFLRKKSRLLSPETAALLLIGAAQSLLKTPQYSALALSESIAKSGDGGGRLDRILGGEIKRGTILAFGSKRSRAYRLSDEGFARAFVLAGKIAEEWH